MPAPWEVASLLIPRGRSWGSSLGMLGRCHHKCRPGWAAPQEWTVPLFLWRYNIIPCSFFQLCTPSLQVQGPWGSGDTAHASGRHPCSRECAGVAPAVSPSFLMTPVSGVASVKYSLIRVARGESPPPAFEPPTLSQLPLS